MKNWERAAGLAVVAGLVAGCASGGGGGGGGSTTAPTSPPTPPPPAIVGVSSSGGELDETGVFSGDFRGPASALGVGPALADNFIGVQPKLPGTVDDIFITVEETTSASDEPTVTISFGGAAFDFDFDNAVDTAMASGFMSESAVATSNGSQTLGLSTYTINFDGTAPEYSALWLFAALDASANTAATSFISIGTDNVTMPSTGSATFDTAVLGIFAADALTPDGGTFFGRGDVSVDFGAGDVTGTFSDVDFDDSAGGLDEMTPGGRDFGLVMDATISGDDFSGTMTATGLTMDGLVEGDFYGPTNASPTEIGGAFALTGADGVAIGGLQGTLK